VARDRGSLVARDALSHERRLVVARIITQKVPIGISACAFNCPVRYNGHAFDALAIMGRERSDFIFTPVCPECLAGLGVPRAPIHLTGTGAEVLAGTATVRDRRNNDVTERVVAGSRDAMAALERAGVVAFIAKEASPTCGLAKARVGKRRTEQLGAGVLGAMLAESGLFLISDEALANSLLWWDARRRLHAWLWLRSREISSARELYDAWHLVKFVIQETARPVADDIGRTLAALPKRVPAEQLDALRTRILDALRTPSAKQRIRSAMFKTYVHAKKKGQLEGVDLHDLTIDSPEVRMNVDELARELTILERVSFENDVLFGTSPVIRRDGRRVAARERESTAPDITPAAASGAEPAPASASNTDASHT
jgi:uncharacterized protein YbbK (DUF523 family)